jgi:hypothetical protein
VVENSAVDINIRYTVMRACNGCRKRKIKCDAATTNTWPCSACTRLKLICVPPTIGQDGDPLGPGEGSEADPASYLHASKQLDPLHHELSIQHNFVAGNSHAAGNMGPYGGGVGIYPSYVPQSHGQLGIYGDAQPPQIAVSHHSFQQPAFPDGPAQSLASADSGVFVEQEQSTAEDLSEALGELKIDETGIGKYSLDDNETCNMYRRSNT